MGYQRIVFYPDNAVIDPLKKEWKKKGYRSLSQYLEDIIAGKVLAGTTHGPSPLSPVTQPAGMGLAEKTRRGKKG